MLRGTAVMVGLPLLQAMMPRARACENGFPRRFGLFFWGNGNRPDLWVPGTTGADWELSDELAPLAGVRDLVTVVSGYSIKLTNSVPHSSGAAGILSAADLEAVGSDYTFSAPSIDQVIAAEIGSETLYASLQTAATDASGLSYNGPSSRNPPETDPWTFYDRIFGASFREPGSSGAVDPSYRLRASVLDAVLDDATALQARVGAEDRERLEQHLEGIRELEARLEKLQEDPPEMESCAAPDAPESSYPDVDGRPQASARSRAMCDLLAMALACDQTRVFAHFFSDPVSDILYEGATAGHHQLTHDEAEPQPEVDAITTMMMGEYAYLVERLQSIPEAEGTLLDNCVIMGTTEVSAGQTHSLDDMPILLAGSACGALQQGIHHRSYTGENVTRVLVSVLRAMDIPAESFGAGEAKASDGVSEIEA
jgi:hypothetical protein